LGNFDFFFNEICVFTVLICLVDLASAPKSNVHLADNFPTSVIAVASMRTPHRFHWPGNLKIREHFQETFQFYFGVLNS